ncbi:unnamed protein product [Ambrosiozyma monospora]|uniref:Unnamed protein product n=1 Tax=Ambrosiozyma monospora TaxID=43982 RepID=A0ACB5SZS8_AMBMO|nr:unnamed protein product [Ambrosiozyma monospora]
MNNLKMNNLQGHHHQDQTPPGSPPPNFTTYPVPDDVQDDEFVRSLKRKITRDTVICINELQASEQQQYQRFQRLTERLAAPAQLADGQLAVAIDAYNRTPNHDNLVVLLRTQFHAFNEFIAAYRIDEAERRREEEERRREEEERRREERREEEERRREEEERRREERRQEEERRREEEERRREERRQEEERRREEEERRREEMGVLTRLAENSINLSRNRNSLNGHLERIWYRDEQGPDHDTYERDLSSLGRIRGLTAENLAIYIDRYHVRVLANMNLPARRDQLFLKLGGNPAFLNRQL